jgi:16S rRNA (cytosine967-C5)-methyltransferase
VLRRAVTFLVDLSTSCEIETHAQAAIAHSVPEWLAEMWWRELGPEDARSLLGSVNEPPETAMRVNLLKADPVDLRAELEAAGEPLVSGTLQSPHDRNAPFSPEALVWEGPLGEAALRALADGRMFAQSRGAQAVVEALAPEPGGQILDLCAGPGVKTVALAALVGADGEVTAVEKEPGRARQIEELSGRAGAANVRVLCADAGQEGAVGQGYDRVLVDPPCSDLGTLNTRPDARWRKDPAAVDRLAGVQERILANGIKALRPGGALVYSTCTISERENEAVVDAALASHPALAERSRVAIRPDRDGTDGFFIATLGTAVARG